MGELADDRISEFRAWLADVIPTAEGDKASRLGLSCMSLSNLLLVWVSWQDRFIPPRKRNVYYLPEFESAAIPTDHIDAVFALQRACEAGADLNHYLSPKPFLFRFKNYREKQGIDWAHKDMTLNAYGLHHLHLKRMSASGKRGGSSEPLLFARFFRDAVEFVHFGNHKSFDSVELRRSVAASNLRRGMELKGILPSTEPYSPDDVKKLIRVGYSMTDQIEGKVVFSAMISSDGSGTEHVRYADRLAEAIEKLASGSAMVNAIPHSREREWWRERVAKLKFRMSWNDLFIYDEETEKALSVLNWIR